MIVLALDTCLAACSVAVRRGDESVAWRSEPMTRGHQERLAPMVREVMAEAGLNFAEVDRIGVTVGPGSFTGLRVGLAFAKGLALALDRPCVGVGVLEALAAGCPETASVTAAVIDAGRGRVYLQIFDNPGATIGPESVEAATALARITERRATGAVTITGPEAGLLLGALPGMNTWAQDVPDPRVVARLAATAQPGPPRPLYLRAPDAKVKGT
jgi:tRNA threonylcarbamoyladenosine biosynthesis protein TsaB